MAVDIVFHYIVESSLRYTFPIWAIVTSTTINAYAVDVIHGPKRDWYVMFVADSHLVHWLLLYSNSEVIVYPYRDTIPNF